MRFWNFILLATLAAPLMATDVSIPSPLLREVAPAVIVEATGTSKPAEIPDISDEASETPTVPDPVEEVSDTPESSEANEEISDPHEAADNGDLDRQKYVFLKQQIENLRAEIAALQAMHEEQLRFNRSMAARAYHEANEIVGELKAEKSRDVDELKCELQYMHNELEILCHPVCDELESTRRPWIGHIEFLYWTIQESELDYVLKGAPRSLAPQGTSGAIGTLKSAEFDWDAGIRLAFAFQGFCDCWNAGIQYTHIDVEGKNSVSRPATTNLNGTLPETVTGNLVREAKSQIAVSYNTIDFRLGKRFCLSNFLQSEVQIAVTGAWIKQGWEVLYLPVTGTVTDNFEIDWKYRGWGMKAGFALDWLVWCGFSLYSEANAAALVGCYNNHFLQQIKDGAAINFVHQDSINEQWRFTETFQIRLGPCFASSRGCFNYRIYALYEMNTWIGLQEVDRSFIGNDPNEGRGSRHVEGFFGLHGVTFGAEIRF